MGEMSDGVWPVTIVPPKPETPADDAGKKPEPPKPDVWPVKKVKEPPKQGE